MLWWWEYFEPQDGTAAEFMNDFADTELNRNYGQSVENLAAYPLQIECKANQAYKETCTAS